MATQIEILAISPDRAQLALYYPVPVGQQIPAAADPNRTAVGSRLSAQESQDLKDGKIVEFVRTVSLTGMKKAESKARIEAAWTEFETPALAGYQKAHRDADLVGKAFDGTSWK